MPRVIGSRSLKAVRKGFSKRSSSDQAARLAAAAGSSGEIGTSSGKLSRAGGVAIVGEGRVVGRDDLGRERRGAAALHDPAHVEARRLLRELAPGEEGGPGRRVARRQEGVCRHHAREGARVLPDHAQPQQTAPVLTHERDVTQARRCDEAAQPVHVLLIAVRLAARGLVGASEADEIGRHRAQARRDEDRNQLAVEKRPGRLAVQQQHDRRRARALVDVVHAQAIPLDVAGGEARSRAGLRSAHRACAGSPWRLASGASGAASYRGPSDAERPPQRAPMGCIAATAAL